MENEEILEERLQEECFTWHWNNFPNERKQLFMVYNNPPSRARGAVLKGMGLIEGASDLIYNATNGKVVYLEAKLPGKHQSREQKIFEDKMRSLGHDYWVFKSLEAFKEIIGSYQKSV